MKDVALGASGGLALRRAGEDCDRVLAVISRSN